MRRQYRPSAQHLSSTVAGAVLGLMLPLVPAAPAAAHGDRATADSVAARDHAPGARALEQAAAGLPDVNRTGPRMPWNAAVERAGTSWPSFPLGLPPQDPLLLSGAAAPETPPMFPAAPVPPGVPVPPEVPDAALGQLPLPGLPGPYPAQPQVEPATVWTSPVPSGHPISAPWGMPGGWAAGRHTGVDFAVPIGTPLYAVGPGTVMAAGDSGDYGKRVMVRMTDGHYVVYAHLSDIAVTEGQELRGGEHIGDSGNTGRSTGPHLHFEVRTSTEYGSDIDPLAYLREHGVSPTSAENAERSSKGSAEPHDMVSD